MSNLELLEEWVLIQREEILAQNPTQDQAKAFENHIKTKMLIDFQREIHVLMDLKGREFREELEKVRKEAKNV